MATRELKPGMIWSALLATTVSSDILGLKAGVHGGRFPSVLEFQVIAEAGTTVISVICQHSLDPNRGFQVLDTLAAAGIAMESVNGGYIQFVNNSNGNVTVLAVCS